MRANSPVPTARARSESNRSTRSFSRVAVSGRSSVGSAQLDTFTFGPGLAADRLPGEGTPLVFLHGLGSARSGTKGNAILEFARSTGRPLYRFDFRGHGDSAGLLEETTISDLRDDTEAMLEAAGRSVLIGSSLGGLIAAWTAARRPELVTGLMLIAPAFGVVPRLAISPVVATAAAGPSCSFELTQRVRDDAAQFDEATLGAQLSMPVLIVHGDHDQTIPVAGAQELFETVPHDSKRLWIVPGGTHDLHDVLDDVVRLRRPGLTAIPAAQTLRDT